MKICSVVVTLHVEEHGMFEDSKNIRETSEISYIEGEEQSHQKIEMTIDEFDELFWLKKFRRALKGDQDTQRRLREKFSAMVIELIRNHPLSVLALGLQNQEFFVTETFRCFWKTAPGYQKYSLNSLSNVLSYLSVSVNTVILDALRISSLLQVIPSTNNQNMADLLFCNNINNLEFWEHIESEYSIPRERKIAYLLFLCALKPVEIIEYFPDELFDRSEILKIRRSIILHGRCSNLVQNK
jgi:hypothetical protein